MDLSKLDRTGRVFAVIGVLAFIDTFLEWAHVSFDLPISITATGWGVGFLGWFPMLLLLALGVLAVLPAFGVSAPRPAGTMGIIGTGVALLGLILIILRWITFPSIDDGVFTASWRPSYALFIGIVLCLVTMVVGWMAYAERGGSLSTLRQSFRSDRRISDVTPGAANAPAPGAQTPAQTSPQTPVQTVSQAPTQTPQAPPPPVQATTPAAPQRPAQTWQAPAEPTRPATPAPAPQEPVPPTTPTTPTEPKD